MISVSDGITWADSESSGGHFDIYSDAAIEAEDRRFFSKLQD
jgi:hypothetical protein